MSGSNAFVRRVGIVGAVGAASLGVVLGIGAGAASAAPPAYAGSGMDFVEHPGWNKDRHDDRGWRDDRGWDHRPHSGFHINIPCVTGPYGVVTWCP